MYRLRYSVLLIAAGLLFLLIRSNEASLPQGRTGAVSMVAVNSHGHHIPSGLKKENPNDLRNKIRIKAFNGNHAFKAADILQPPAFCFNERQRHCFGSEPCLYMHIFFRKSLRSPPACL